MYSILAISVRIYHNTKQPLSVAQPLSACYSNFSLFYALATAATKKTTIGDRQCTYYLIVRAVTVADFTIDRPALLEINRKIATMGGGGSHRVKKKPHFVRRLSVFWVFFALRKK